MGRAADFRKMGSIVDKEVSLHGERMKENPDVPAQELVPQFEDYICDTTPNGKKNGPWEATSRPYPKTAAVHCDILGYFEVYNILKYAKTST